MIRVSQGLSKKYNQFPYQIYFFKNLSAFCVHLKKTGTSDTKNVWFFALHAPNISFINNKKYVDLYTRLFENLNPQQLIAFSWLQLNIKLPIKKNMKVK